MKRPQPAKPTVLADPWAVLRSSSPRVLFAALVCLAAIVFAVYSPTCNFQFILDDERYTADPRIRESGHVWEYFSNYVWAQFVGGPPSFYRPVFLLWMRLNFILNALSPWGWHVLSIAKHIAVAILLGMLVWKLLRDSLAAVLASALFALHPAQVESVSWLSVPDPLMASLLLLAVIFYRAYVAGVEEPRKTSLKKSRKTPTRSPRPGWLLASALAYFLALLTKETAIIFPVVIFALASVSSRNAPEAGESRAIFLRSQFLQPLRHVVPFMLATVVYLAMRFHAFGGKLGSATQQLPWRTIVLSWPSTLWFYVKAMFWPVRSYAFGDSNLADQFSFRAVALPLMGLICCAMILAIGARLLIKKGRRKADITEPVSVEWGVTMGSLFLVLPLLPALNLNALNPGDFLHGRYTYLPLVGLMVLIATAWHFLDVKIKLATLAIACVLAGAFSMLTVSQERQWSDDDTVFAVAHQLAPNNIPVTRHFSDSHVRAALRLADAGRCDQALVTFDQVIAQFPDDWYAWAGKGYCFVKLNDFAKAEESLHRAADLSHNAEVVRQWRAVRTEMGLPNARSGQ